MQWVSIFQSLGCNSLQSQWENHTDLQYTMNRKLLATIQLSLHFSWLIKNPLPLKRSPNPYDTDKWTTDIMTHIKSSTNEGKMWFTNRHKADASQRCEPQMRDRDVRHRCEPKMRARNVSHSCEPEMWASHASHKCEPQMKAREPVAQRHQDAQKASIVDLIIHIAHKSCTRSDHFHVNSHLKSTASRIRVKLKTRTIYNL